MVFGMIMLINSNAVALMNVVPNVKSFRYVGSTQPLPNFDPLKILKHKNENQVKFTREAELMHGRIAMVATVVIPIIEHMHKDNSILGINYLSSENIYHLTPVWLGITSYELLRIEKGWEIPFSEYKTFKFKYNYQPGNLGNFDMSTISDDLLNKELNNGRLAMIAFMGILTQELVTGKNIF